MADPVDIRHYISSGKFQRTFLSSLYSTHQRAEATLLKRSDAHRRTDSRWLRFLNSGQEGFPLVGHYLVCQQEAGAGSEFFTQW